MAKIIFSADLHGSEVFYKRLLKKAEDNKIDAVVIGGDLCGREGDSIKEKIQNQKIFLKRFMIPLFKKFKGKNKNKEIYLIMGNDDYKSNMEILETAEKNGTLKSMHGRFAKLDQNLNICGYSFVNITPFRLKDWEKPDFKDDIGPKQLFDEEIRSVNKEEGTIDEDLKKLKKLSDPKKTIYVIHAPPFNTKLDIVLDGAHVGSKAIRNFIEKEQPPLTLHGHIHESPKMSGSWIDKTGKSICINVGSRYPKDVLNCAIIDTENLDNVNYIEI